MLLDIVFFVIFFGLITAGLTAYINKKYPKGERRFLVLGSLISFALRAGLVFVTIVVPRLLLPSDAGLYEGIGLQLADFLKQGILFPEIENLYGVNFSYFYINAAVYMIFGFHPVILRLINCAFGVLAALVLYDVCKSVKSTRCGKLGFLMLGFMPSLMFYSSLNLKDTLLVLIITLIIKAFIKIIEKVSLKYIALIAVLIGLIFSLRFYIGMIAMGVFILLLAMVIRIPWKTKIVVLGVLLAACGTATYLAGYGFMGSELISFYFNFDFFNSHREALRDRYPDAASNIFLDVRFYNMLDVLKFLPVGLVYFMFAPFPWAVKGMLQIGTLPENIVWYILFMGFAVPGIKFFARRENIRTGVMMAAFCGTITLLYALSLDNLGIAYRMKFQILPFWFMVIASGIDEYLSIRSTGLPAILKKLG